MTNYPVQFYICTLSESLVALCNCTIAKMELRIE